MSQRPIFPSPSAFDSGGLRAWHRRLVSKEGRADRARLRRAGSLEDAALAPGFHQLLGYTGLAPDTLSAEQMAGFAAFAVLSAGVDADTPDRPLGRSLGSGPDGQAPVSEARFRRLLASDQLTDRFEVLRRLLHLLGRQVDLGELALAVLNWTPSRRRQLAYDYYSATTPSFAAREESAS
jgi:CRISPR type I-E-associated protein CasB/Cse2